MHEQAIADRDQRKLLTLTMVEEWAIAGPKSLKDDKRAEEICDNLRRLRTAQDETWPGELAALHVKVKAAERGMKFAERDAARLNREMLTLRGDKEPLSDTQRLRAAVLRNEAEVAGLKQVNSDLEAHQAALCGCQWAFLSPVGHPTSKPNDCRPPIGEAAVLRAQRALPELDIMALGGVTPAAAARLAAGGGRGVAVLGGIFRKGHGTTTPEAQAAAAAYLDSLAEVTKHARALHVS